MNRIKKSDATKTLLAFVFIALIFIPLVNMFMYMDKESVDKVVSSPVFGTAVKNSLASTLVSTVITVALAFALAMSIERSSIKFKKIFSVLFSLPMLVPSISIGMGLTILLGNNGILTKIFGMGQGIYGFWGIVMGSVLYAFPVAFLMLSDIIRYEDSSPYEAAKVLGLSKFRQFTAIMFPYLKKPLINVVFATFTMIVTDYGVPLMIGGKYTTIPVVMYQEVIGQLDFGKGSVYGSLLLIPAVIAFILDVLNRERAGNSFVPKRYIPSNRVLNRVLAYVACVIGTIFTLLPILSFIMLSFSTDYPNEMSFTFDNVIRTMELHAGEYLINSVIIAFLVSLVGIVVAFFTAYLSARMQSKMSKFLHLSAMISAAIPGLVLGLSYVITFKTSPMYGTIIILVMVNLVHFISSPYLMMYNSLSKVNSNLESVGHTLGISRVYMIKDVFIPMTKSTILEMFSYFFVNCMMTISAVSFLANTSNKPVSLMINQFEAQMQLESAAVVSLMILVINLIIKGVFHMLKREKHA